ncbi:MAG: hypothetical protein WCD70_01645 [Alphaproteobacteria bacterium]
MPTNVECAYAAGLFDGEGSVGISYRMQSKKSKKQTYSVKASIAMIDEESILWMVSTFGGHYDTTNRTKGGNVVHRWTLHCRKAADFFEAVLPYLKLKRSRAEAGMKLARMSRKRGAVKGSEGMQPMTDAEIEVQKPLADFIRSANLRSNAKIASYSTWGVN